MIAAVGDAISPLLADLVVLPDLNFPVPNPKVEYANAVDVEADALVKGDPSLVPLTVATKEENEAITAPAIVLNLNLEPFAFDVINMNIHLPPVLIDLNALNAAEDHAPSAIHDLNVEVDADINILAEGEDPFFLPPALIDLNAVIVYHAPPPAVDEEADAGLDINISGCYSD